MTSFIDYLSTQNYIASSTASIPSYGFAGLKYQERRRLEGVFKGAVSSLSSNEQMTMKMHAENISTSARNKIIAFIERLWEKFLIFLGFTCSIEELQRSRIMAWNQIYKIEGNVDTASIVVISDIHDLPDREKNFDRFTYAYRGHQGTHILLEGVTLPGNYPDLALWDDPQANRQQLALFAKRASLIQCVVAACNNYRASLNKPPIKAENTAEINAFLEQLPRLPKYGPAIICEQQACSGLNLEIERVNTIRNEALIAAIIHSKHTYPNKKIFVLAGGQHVNAVKARLISLFSTTIAFASFKDSRPPSCDYLLQLIKK